ncbi:hypothetical protein EAE99_001468 [Botrytis elliptica]|nr:hypothetical protein EAE99_001468 [Botrytis elliptica]
MSAPEYATKLPGYLSATLPSFSKTASNTARAATDADWFHQWLNGRDRAGKKLHDQQPMVISRVKMRRDSHIDHDSTIKHKQTPFTNFHPRLNHSHNINSINLNRAFAFSSNNPIRSQNISTQIM